MCPLWSRSSLTMRVSSQQYFFQKTDQTPREHHPEDFGLELIESDECCHAHRGGKPVRVGDKALRKNDSRPEDESQI